MDSLEECIAVYADLLVRLKELDELRERMGELRERVEKAKKLFTGDAGSTEAEARQLSLTGSRTPNIH